MSAVAADIKFPDFIPYYFVLEYKDYKTYWEHSETEIPAKYNENAAIAAFYTGCVKGLRHACFKQIITSEEHSAHEFRVPRLGEFFTGFRLINAQNVKQVQIKFTDCIMKTFDFTTDFVDFKYGPWDVYRIKNEHVWINVDKLDYYRIWGAIPTMCICWHDIFLSFVPLNPDLPASADIEYEYITLTEREDRHQLMRSRGEFNIKDGPNMFYSNGMVMLDTKVVSNEPVEYESLVRIINKNSL
jgi:hypothetical protein